MGVNTSHSPCAASALQKSAPYQLDFALYAAPNARSAAHTAHIQTRGPDREVKHCTGLWSSYIVFLVISLAVGTCLALDNCESLSLRNLFCDVFFSGWTLHCLHYLWKLEGNRCDQFGLAALWSANVSAFFKSVSTDVVSRAGEPTAAAADGGMLMQC